MKTIVAISRNLSIDENNDNGIPLGEVIQSFSMPDEESFQKKWEELLSYQTHKDLFYFKEIVSADNLSTLLNDDDYSISFNNEEILKLKTRGEIKEKLGSDVTLKDLTKTSKKNKPVKDTPIDDTPVDTPIDDKKDKSIKGGK